MGSRSQGSWVRGSWVRATMLLAVRPHLWPAAWRHALRTSPPGWWRRAPFLPVPSPAYLRFRSRTAYGDERPPRPRDVVDYLEWCRERDRARGR